jgi:hypothetical protein
VKLAGILWLQVEVLALSRAGSNFADFVQTSVAHLANYTSSQERNAMIGHCFNPECGEELRYLRQGSVYAWETGVPEFHVECFWLCSTCSRRYRVASDKMGRPVLSPNTLGIWSSRQGCRVRRVLRECCKSM